MKRALTFLLILSIAGVLGLGLFLFRPFLSYPTPAPLQCVSEEAGALRPLGEPHRVFGLGLSFAGWNVVAASLCVILLLFGATRPARRTV